MNDFLMQFHFLRPVWLLALIAVGAMCFWLLRHQKTANQWSRYINPALLSHLLDKTHVKQKRWPIWGALCLWIATCLALAGPTWQQLPQPVEQTTEALVLCWDLSPSMLAQDIKPSRLNRARLKIIDLLKSRDEGLFALVAYSGEAYTVTPLTDDTQTIINLLPALSPAHLPTVGSNPEMALDNAQALLKAAGASTGNIIFITDGIDSGAYNYLIDEAKKSPYKITFWPVGTAEGAPIPLPNGGFAKDSTGNMVIPKLDQNALQSLASKADAYYVPMNTSDSDIKTLSLLLEPNHSETATTERNFDQWFEHGQYLALFLLPFLALLFRNGWIFCLLLGSTLIYSPSSQASIWDDLWKTQDQQAAEKLNAGNTEAAELFSTPERRGSALYQQQEYAKAAEEFAKSEASKRDGSSAFNRGTSLAQTGKFEDAIKAFDEALKQNPELEAAKKNKAIAQQLADMQKQQDQQNQDQNGENPSEGSENQDSQNQDSQNQDQQESQGQKNSQDQNSGQQNQQADNSQNDQNQAGDPSDANKAQQQADSQHGDQQQAQSEEQTGEEQKTEDNPYAGVNPEDSKKQDEQEQEQLSKGEPAEEEEQQAQQQQAMALTGAPTGEKSEEEQQLEMMLRKVPDDPGGLLREKFRYQYQQRKQDASRSLSKNEAESRW